MTGWTLSSAELDYAPGADGIPEAVIDASVPGAAVPAVQPGVHDASGGFISHRIVVRFATDDDGADAGATLRLFGTAERGPVPDLEIVLDGRRGILHPEVERRDRTGTGEPGPVAGLVHVDVPFPSEWLNAGEHVLTVTTVLDHAAALGEQSGASHDAATCPGEDLPASRATYGKWFGSYLRWHEFALEAGGTTQTQAPTAGVRLRVTPFYVRQGEAEAELVDLDVVRLPGAAAPGETLISWDGGRIVAPAFPADRDFGQFRFRFPAGGFERPCTFAVGDGEHASAVELRPARRWTLHLIPHVHLDLGFTDAQGKVLDLHCRNIDRALDRFDIDPAFRFAVDGSHIVEQFERTRAPRQVERMRRAVAAGRLGVNALHSNPLSGLLTLPEMIHSTDHALTLPEPPEGTARYANITDVPTHNRAIATVLAKRGIRGFVAMSNHGRAATDSSDELHLASPVRWKGTNDTEVLAFFADHYSQLRFVAGDPQAVAGATDGLGRLLARYERDDYLPTDLPVIGTHADNEDIGDGDTGFVERWNEAFAWPRMRVSTFGEYLAGVDHLREELPLWDREMGTYWEDGVGSAAADFARYREAQAVLPAAETLSTLVASRNRALRPAVEEFERAWRDMLIASEHTLTWSQATSHPHGAAVADQLEWKTHRIVDAHRVAIDESRRSLAQLAAAEHIVGPGVIVYNPHSWTTDVQAKAELKTGVTLLDGDGSLVEHEVLDDCAGLQTIRFTARRMPAHGWRFFPATAMHRTLPGGEAAPRERVGTVGTSDGFSTDGIGTDGIVATDGIRSAAWHVELDPVTSLPLQLTHLPSGRRLLDERSGVRFGQIVRAAGAPFDEDEANLLRRPRDQHAHSRNRLLGIENFRYVPNPEPDAIVEESPSMRFEGARPTFDGVRLRWRGEGASVRHAVVELLLNDASGEGELTVTFDKQPCLDMEAVYVAFPFRSDPSKLRYDRPLGWIEPARQHGPGAGDEWFTATNSVALDSGDGTVIWTPKDAALFTVGDIVRGRWPSEYKPTGAVLYSYAMNNAWPCNTPPAQDGSVRFRYVFALAQEFEAARAATVARMSRLDGISAEILPLDNLSRLDASPFYAEGDLGLAAPTGITLDASTAAGGDITVLMANASDTSAEVAPADLGIGYRIESASSDAIGAGDYVTHTYRATDHDLT